MTFLLPMLKQETMNKILLIISREYLSRVRKKSFIIMTFLGPVLISGIWLVPIWLAERGVEEKKIQVYDESGLFLNSFNNSNKFNFEIITGDVEEKKQEVRDEVYDALLVIPKIDIYDPKNIELFTQSSPGMDLVQSVERMIEDQIVALKMEESGIDKKDLDKIKTDISLGTINLTETGEQESNTGASMGAGLLFTFMIYMFIFVYGVQVMRGVIEEKSNKIVEVIISSVKPFQLMLGKISGVAAVVITQLLLWIGLSALILLVVTTMTGFDIEAAQMNPESVAQGNAMVGKIAGSILKLEISKILGSFVFYFLGGYLFYAALFAAVGSAVDSDSDTQQFMLPITIPLILGLVISTSVVINDPHGSIAFWASMIPFTSPIVMMMRVPFDVPLWELLLSMFFLIIGFVGTTWIAGRIYRVGILMHGTKVNYKVLGKWFFMKS